VCKATFELVWFVVSAAIQICINIKIFVVAAFNSSCEASSLFLQECPHLRMTREMLHQVKSPCIYQNFEKHKEL
jgi:hypothetical protein